MRGPLKCAVDPWSGSDSGSRVLQRQVAGAVPASIMNGPAWHIRLPLCTGMTRPSSQLRSCLGHHNCIPSLQKKWRRLLFSCIYHPDFEYTCAYGCSLLLLCIIHKASRYPLEHLKRSNVKGQLLLRERYRSCYNDYWKLCSL